MIAEIALFVILAAGFAVATWKVWRGESHLDRDNAPAFWPFSVELWRGAGRALPALGLGTLLVIGAGILSELVGDEDWIMAAGAAGLLVMLCVGFPVMYLNLPKWAVPPPWRDDPPIYPRRRAQGAADQRRRDRG